MKVAPTTSPQAVLSDLDHKYRKPLFAAAIRMAREHFTAEDLVQETMLRACVALDNGSLRVEPKDDHRLFRWMLRVLRGVWIDEVRTDRARREHELVASKYLTRRAAFQEEPSDSLEQDDIDAIDYLSPRQREAAKLYFSDDNTTLQEIAERLDCSTSTVWRDIEYVHSLIARKDDGPGPFSNRVGT